MPTVLKKAFVVFMLLVLVVNQTVPVSASQNRAQTPVLGLAAALVTKPIMHREMGKKAARVQAPTAPEPAKVRIKLSASPKFITGAGIVTVSWSIAGDVPAAASLQISFPDGYIPGGSAGSYDAAAHTLSIPAATTSGLFPLTIQNPVDDAIFPAVLLDSAGKALAQEELALPRHEKFSAKKGAGSFLSAENGRVKVRFGKNSLPEDVTVNIGAPTGEIMPNGSLSGQPFEIDAQGVTSKTDFHQFADEISIDVDYSKLDLHGNDENNLYLYYYNPDDNNWYALPTTVDLKTKTMHAVTNHFTVFDSGINNFKASRLPTVDSFQVSSFTGAATYDLPIEVPAGRSGLQPNLSLSYNSQTIDQSTAQTQASWVGMGWSLGMNSIELDDHGTNPLNDPISWSSDDTWLVNVNGISSTIVLVGGDYRAADQNFVDFSYDSTNDTWTVQDKQGNRYYFNKQVKTVYTLSGNSQSQCDYQLKTYQWYLTRMENVFGRALTYSYVNESKTLNMPQWETGSNACRNQLPVSLVTATYPDTITYPGGGYRIRFVREARPDYRYSWAADAAYHNFQKTRLNSILVEQGTGNGPTFSNYALIRKYVFEYASTSPQEWATTVDGNTRAPVWPGVTWNADGRTSTLLQVHQFDGSGVNELPTAIFSYEDKMHLTRADNGYGGSIHFDYEAWHYDAKSRMSQTYKEDFNYGNTCGAGHFAAYNGHSVVECIHNSGNSINFLKLRGIAIDTQLLGGWQIQNNAIRPGGFYKFVFKNVLAVGDNTQMRFTLGDMGASSLVYHTDSTDVIPLDVDSSKVDVFLQATNSGLATANTNYVTLTNVTVELLTSIYRVTSRTIDDGQRHSYNYQYTYTGAAVNDSVHSDSSCDDASMTAVPPTCQQYYEKYAEFRGHSIVTETGPDGHKTITAFNQDDVLKGRASSVTTKDVSGKVLSWHMTNYTVSNLAAVLLAANNLPYNDVLRYWAKIDTEENRTYDNAGGYDATQTTYTYEGLYGNLLRKAESSLNDSNVWELFRTSQIFYAVVSNGGPYLNSLPILQSVTDKDGVVLSQSLSLYDNHPAWNTPPTDGIPTGARVWVNNGNYSQVSYGYDAWGNRNTTSSYSTFATSTTNPIGSPITQTTDFDPIYHTYPVGQHTPAMPGFPNGFTTTIDYDYNLGLPISQTSNGDLSTKVTAHYDSFGRLTSLVKPGDSNASPTFQVAYNDFSQPFRIDLRQKIDNSNSYMLRHSYDGLGREIKSETGHGSSFANFVLDSQVDSQYFYDNVAGQSISKQSTPYLGNEAIYYSTSYADALGRPVKTIAPDGSQTKYSYNGLSSTVTDANQHSTTTVADVWGRTLSVTPPTGPGVSYTYNPLGELLTATRGAPTTITSITYDKAGHKTKMVDPDMGTWYYKYDALGNMIAQVDAAGQVINLYYDLMNRLKGKTYATTSNGNAYARPADPNAYAISYTYDAGQYGIGKRTGMSANAGADTSTWTYDVRGRATREHKVIDGQAFDTNTSYNSADLPLTITYPDGEIVSNHYNARMMLDTVAGADNYIRATAYDSAGRMTSRTLGNGVKSDYTFNPWNVQGGRLLNLTTSNPATQTTLQNIAYTYDAIGNIKSIADTLNNQTQTFNYDSLDRLTQAYTTGSTDGAYSENYSYDLVSGNLKTKAGSTLYYDDVNHKHAVTSMGTSTYIYDPDGNQIQRTVNGYTYKLDYDPEGHLVAVTNLKTPTPIASPSATVTATSTITSTASPSGTVTLTSTVTPTAPATDTVIPIASPSGTESPTETLAPSVTATASPLGVASPTETVTQTPTASPSATAIATASETVIQTPTVVGGAAPQSNLFLASYRQGPAHIWSDAPLNTFAAIKTWGFNINTEGWTDVVGGTTSGFGWQAGGTIGATVTGPGARVFSPADQSINITNNKIIKIRYKNSTASSMGYLYFMTGSDTAFGGSGKIMSVALAPNSNYTEYTINVSNVPAWTGTLTRLRFDIGAATSGSFAIDYVQIGSESATPTKTVTPTKTTTPTITPTSTPGGVAEAVMQFKSLSAQFRYDGDGNMVKAVMDGVTTVYVSPMYQIKTDPTVDSGQPIITKYYPGGAIRTSHSALGTSELSYILSDHLGSSSLTTDASGAKVAEMRYKPWGEVRFANGDLHTDKTYTGQRTYASDFGLMYYNARWYDSSIGRFAQADSVVPDGIQGYDRYAYVNNNPMNFTDLNGHNASDPADCVGHGSCGGREAGPYIEHVFPPRVDPEPEVIPEILPEGADKIDKTLLGNNKNAIALRAVYYKMYVQKDGWWWHNGHFTIWDFMGLMWGYEKNIFPNSATFITAMSNHAAGWSLDYNTAEGALSFMGKFSQTPVARALGIQDGSMTLAQAFAEQGDTATGIGLVNAIRNHPGGPFGAHDLYDWGNWSNHPKIYTKLKNLGAIHQIWGGGDSVVILEYCQWQVMNDILNGRLVNQQTVTKYCGGN